ncbi:MAG: MBOAT family protein [Crocinitomicaceae bacterium]|nr:MBOAT family protein [Crocinitomicaceae bacterium]
MLFNSIDFILFLPIVVVLYFAIPHKFRWILLLAASYYFYMCWKVEYVLLIVLSTVIDFYMGILMDKLPTQKARTPLLIVSLIFNLGTLFLFKYYNFASENINLLVDKIGMNHHLPVLNLLLPVGISFYTFQTLSYTIDVYFGRQKAERHLGYFALYVSFFPQLVAGPIERFSRLTPQLKEFHQLKYENLSKGFRLILYGLFIKMVIADNLASYVDLIYDSPTSYSSWDVLKGVFMYSFQIYNDFYGYSLVAIGSAKIMGIDLMDNFRTPYLAKNIMEFWQRWHISLSTWFRDYLYFPLGGNRVTKSKWMMNIAIVFIVSGFWHGANWTFIIWGALYGVIYLIEKNTNDLLKLKTNHTDFSFGHILLAIKTFVFVTFIWVFFRSQSVHEAFVIFNSIFNFHAVGQLSLEIPALVWILLALFILSDILLYNKRFDTLLDNIPFAGRWLIYSFLLFSIIVFSSVEIFPFIYFQF